MIDLKGLEEQMNNKIKLETPLNDNNNNLEVKKKEKKPRVKVQPFKKIYDPDSKLEDRPEQVEVAKNILEELKENDAMIIEAPTGWGKTGLAYQIYNQSKKVINGKCEHSRVLILNHNNKLLDQYIDLLERNVKDCISIKGKRNYQCARNLATTVDLADCRGCKRSKAPNENTPPDCEYYARKFLADKYKLVISNYHQQFSRINIGDPIQKFDILVCDECHNLEKILVDYATVRVSNKIVSDITKQLNDTDEYYEKAKSKKKKEDEFDEDTDSYRGLLWQKLKPMAMDTLDKLHKAVQELNSSNYKEKFDSFYETLSSFVNYCEGSTMSLLQKCDPSLYIDLSSLCGTYSIYKLSEDDKMDYYIYEEDIYEKSYALVPLSIKSFFHKYVASLADKIVLMSATVINPDNMISDLGLSVDKTKTMTLDSKVPTTNRPIYTLCNCNIDIKDPKYSETSDFTFLMDQIDNILDMMYNSNFSGYIFCNSYKLAEMVCNELRNRNSPWNILMNTSSKEADYILEKFRDTSIKNRLLISCSFTEGVNFEDDISRFQIIVKVPFLYLGSERNKEKKKLNPRWYTNKAIEQIIQAAGRSVRSPQDFAMTYILDSSFKRAYSRYKNDYPVWFNEALIDL